MDGARPGISGRTARICVAGLVLLATLATVRAPEAAADVAPAWSKVRFDGANTAFNTSERWLSAGNVGSLALDWTSRISPRESPLVSGGVIYAGCDDRWFCALDATNGSTRWKTEVGVGVPARWAALAGGVVYLNGSSFQGNAYSPVLLALDAGSGAVLWRTLIMNGCCGGTTPITVAEGLVIQRWKDSLLAWDAATGIQRWVVPLLAGGVPAVVNGVVYV
ncbi:MAG TPA: PQQ-binding-like beta-propeller repeat protein [Acidimicrobiales bacterium]|nr:PQQ-binding-like beta-propeller repeat protein [Acidimicrobiales bacterium]